MSSTGCGAFITFIINLNFATFVNEAARRALTSNSLLSPTFVPSKLKDLIHSSLIVPSMCVLVGV